MFFGSLKEYEGMKPGLSRIKKFLDAAGNPQDKFKCVHIAGTNGKGSVAVLIANALKESGYKTALYTSPHLIDITERINVDGKNISKKRFNGICEKYLALAQKHKLSYFEYLTAVAFIYFAQKKVKIAVIETGLGGRFDATNVIKNPLVCVITSISSDHKEVLGNTVAKIAFEKAGIIKSGADTVCGNLPGAALETVKKKSKPFVLGKDFKAENTKINRLKKSQSFDYCGIEKKIKNINLSLLGEYQFQNAAVAACCIELLNNKNFVVPDKILKQSFFKTRWPARFDLRKAALKDKRINLIIDGSHNEQGINAFTDALGAFYNKKLCFLFAVMKEKDYKKIIKKIIPYASKVILVKIQNDRAVDADKLEKEFLKYKFDKKILKAGSTAAALDMLSNGETAAVVGSLYLAGEILKNIYNEV
ncbi:MAG: bifunctional folylpolyglutamate synthase/dihydrofolate synthase [Endomicrobia bacterium]|nr:bifunctional folylpolyglutamate synthase/dihydrofolate synthase [Endomicrobiia bacterium]